MNKTSILFILNIILVVLIVKISNVGSRIDHSIEKSNWKVISFSSEEKHSPSQVAANAIDNNYDTYWHSEWVDNKPGLPHFIVVDMGKDYLVNGFYYHHRLDSVSGRVKSFKLYGARTLEDLDTSQPLLVKSVGIGASTKQFYFSITEIRFFKFVILQEVNGNSFSSVGEVGFYEAR